MDVIKPGELASAIAESLEEYAGLLQLDLEESVDSVSKETVAEIRKDARSKFGGTGDYAKSWTSKKDVGSTTEYSRVIYAKAPFYRIAHLLERGYAKVNGGRVEGRPHIAPAEQRAAQKLERRLLDAIKRNK